MTQQLVETQSWPLVERLPAHMDTEGEARPGAEACPASHQLALGRPGAPHCPCSMGDKNCTVYSVPYHPLLTVLEESLCFSDKSLWVRVWYRYVFVHPP